MSCSLVLCTGALVFALLHFGQHPVAFSLLSLFLVRTILDAKVERVVVLEDRMVVISRRVLPWMTRRQVVLL